MFRERGQASIEWIAVVGVVAAAFLAAAAGAVPGVRAIPRAVEAGFARAYCLVSGGDCLDEGGPRPCVVHADERSRRRKAAVVVVRLSDGRTVLREERSDGSVVLTVEDGARLGASLALGGKLSVGALRVSGGGGVSADAGGGVGRRFELKSAAAADAVLTRLGEESPGVPSIARRIAGGGDAEGMEPDERWWSVAGDGEADASLGALGLRAQLGLVRELVAGVRVREATGERTVVLTIDDALAGALGGPMAGVDAGLTHARTVELGFDRRGRATSLTVRGTRSVRGSAELGPLRADGGNLVEAEARLDLGDRVMRGHARAFLDALGDVAPGRAVAAARALGERLAERARVDLRLYATTRSSSVSGVTIGFLGRMGYQVENVHSTARLVDAIGREPGMGWTRRFDCVGVA